MTSLQQANGNTGAQYAYDAWGNIIAMQGDLAELNPLRYRGYVYDQETGFYYLNSRYYDPATGRFLNADSYTAANQNVVGHNMFAYCENNPVAFQDSQGDFAISALSMFTGVAINVVTTVVAAKVTGQSISWLDVGVAAVAGAVSSIENGGRLAAGIISGGYSAFMAFRNGASVGGVIATGLASGLGAALGGTNGLSEPVRDMLSAGVKAVFDAVFVQSANLLSAVTFKVSTESGQRAAAKTAQPAAVARHTNPTSKHIIQPTPGYKKQLFMERRLAMLM